MAKGGKREGAGRKSKAEELGLSKLVEDVIGEVGKRKLIQKIFNQATTGSYNHQQLLMAYIYGKPKEKLDVTTNGNEIGSQEIIFKDYSKNAKP